MKNSKKVPPFARSSLNCPAKADHLTSSCNKKEEEVSKRDDLPISISLKIEDVDAIIEENRDDICDRYGDIFTSVYTPDINGRQYLVTLGWGFQTDEVVSGQANMVFAGESLIDGQLPPMREMLETAISEHSETNPKVGVELVLYINGGYYRSMNVDRVNTSLGYVDPNRIESLSYRLGTEPISCLENQSVLSFEYDFSGYMYNQYNGDSIFVEYSNFVVSTQILGY